MPATKKTTFSHKKTVLATKPKSKSIVKTADGTRLKKLNRKQSKKQLKTTQKQLPLPNAFVLLSKSLQHLWRNKRLFAGLLLVYAVLYVLFVKGISANFQLGSLRDNLNSAFGGKMSKLNTAVALYGLLLGSSTSSSNQSGSLYQTIFIIIMSLALIWALRQTYAADHKISVRDSFYKGMYPLIPFIGVLFVVMLQFLPALTVGSLYSYVQGNGIVVGFAQQAIATSILVLGMFWTFYMVSSSLFALYIVTLPDARPMASLRAAKKLVKYRRLLIMRKVFTLPVMLLLFSAIVLIPLIILLPVAAELLFMAFTVGLLAVIHSYCYTLYRSLL